MGKFAVSNDWDTKAKPLKFKKLKGNANAAENKSKKSKSKNKNKLQKQQQETENADYNVPLQGKGPLAPKLLQKLNKVKSGRIEKAKKPAKNAAAAALLGKKQQQTKLKPDLALAAAAQCFEGEWSNKSVSNASNNTLMETDANANNFQAKLKQQLMGGRFRFLNEQLYTMSSSNAETLFREDADAFSAYHAGYRQQVAKWPLNPLQRIIKMLRKLPKTLTVGDFGCGEALLAKSLPNKVYSMDLVSCRQDIIACNMDNTPLEQYSLDVAVYCLSLMGTNLNDFLLEANRVLKLHGLMLIAEIQSRFDNVQQFVRGLEACGFELLKKDTNHKLFYFFQFKKVRHVGRVAKLPALQLKPCTYKKR